jgi:hypothetical protein
MKMKWQRRKYLKFMHLRKKNASTMIQKYVKGYVVFKEYKEIVHNKIIDGMMDHFRKVKMKIDLNS